MRLLVALLLAHTLTGGAPPLPWHSYADVPVQHMAPACGGTAILVSIDEHWQALSNETRDMFLHLTNGTPDYVYLARGTPSSGPIVQRVLTFAQAEKLYPDPCAYLTENEAHHREL